MLAYIGACHRELSIKLLEDVGISTFIIGKETTDDEVKAKMEEFNDILNRGKNVAFLIRKGAWIFRCDEVANPEKWKS